MNLIIDISSWVLIVTGSLALVIGAIGVLRFPDIYTRMHAASITDTLGAGALLGGLMLQAGLSLIAVKLFMTLAFLFFTSPTSSFALAHAAMSSGVEPQLDHDLRSEPEALPGDSPDKEKSS